VSAIQCTERKLCAVQKDCSAMKEMPLRMNVLNCLRVCPYVISTTGPNNDLSSTQKT
jgi:hypothetical protein